MLGPVELVDEVDSTNRVLLDRARAGAPHGLVLVADHQTAGRGRLGRTWQDEPGTALLVSVLLRPSLPVEEVHLLTVAGGLAAVDACAAVGGARLSLKWPNDLVSERDGATRKLAGLLAESLIDGDRVDAVVLGIGLNLRSVGLPDEAVALDDVADAPVSRDELLQAWLRALEARLHPWDRTRLIEAYRSACVTIGRSVHVTQASGIVDGTALGVDVNGHLIVDTVSGRRVLTAGDVVHVRAV